MKKLILSVLASVLLFSSCGAEEPAVTEESTVSETETPLYHEFVYTTEYPDGTFFESYDGKTWYEKTFDGENWIIKSEPAEEPLIYIHAFSDNVYDLENAQVMISVYNKGVEESIGTSSCGGMLYYCYDGGWDRAPYKENAAWTSDFNSLWKGAHKSFNAFPVNSLETAEKGRYRYEVEYLVSHSRGEKNYTCTFEYDIT
ncbi:MAG: hypothetical protein IJY73_05240 [Oscillospiraceae bacterium]|nr:hypothetical protein [Oscillospiraceae bacterium]